MMLTLAHRWAIAMAIMGAALLLAAMLFGKEWYLPSIIGFDRSVRDVALAAWVVAVPGWFTIEEQWAPKSQDALIEFRAAQQHARNGWLVAAALVAVIIGTSSPNTSMSAKNSASQNQPGTPVTNPVTKQ